MLEKDQTVNEKIVTKIIKMIEMARLGEFWHDDWIYVCIPVYTWYLQLLNTKLNQFNTKRPQILGFQPVILASANQCVCPGGHIWLCYQFIYCIYLSAQAGFSIYGRIFHIDAKFLYKILIKNLKLKWYSVI